MARLLPDWRRIVRRAWSFKFMAAAVVLSGVEVYMSIRQPDGLPPGVFAGLAGVVTSAAMVARLLAQIEVEAPSDAAKK